MKGMGEKSNIKMATATAPRSAVTRGGNTIRPIAPRPVVFAFLKGCVMAKPKGKENGAAPGKATAPSDAKPEGPNAAKAEGNTAEPASQSEKSLAEIAVLAFEIIAAKTGKVFPFDPIAFLRDAGLAVTVMDLAECRGFISQPKDATAQAYLNNRDSETLRRWTATCLLFAYITQAELGVDNAVDPSAPEADLFATLLLMPEAEIREAWRSSTALERDDAEAVKVVAGALDVPIEYAESRIKTLGLITEG